MNTLHRWNRDTLEYQSTQLDQVDAIHSFAVDEDNIYLPIIDWNSGGNLRIYKLNRQTLETEDNALYNNITNIYTLSSDAEYLYAACIINWDTTHIVKIEKSSLEHVATSNALPYYYIRRHSIAAMGNIYILHEYGNLSRFDTSTLTHQTTEDLNWIDTIAADTEHVYIAAWAELQRLHPQTLEVLASVDSIGELAGYIQAAAADDKYIYLASTEVQNYTLIHKFNKTTLEYIGEFARFAGANYTYHTFFMNVVQV